MSKFIVLAINLGTYTPYQHTDARLGEPRDLYKAILQELCDRIRARKSSRDTLGACLQVMYYIFCEYEELVKNYVKPELGLTSFVQEILATEPTEDDSVVIIAIVHTKSIVVRACLITRIFRIAGCPGSLQRCHGPETDAWFRRI